MLLVCHKSLLKSLITSTIKNPAENKQECKYHENKANLMTFWKHGRKREVAQI